MKPNQSLIAEMEAAIEGGSNDKCVDAMRRITDLFVVSAERLNTEQIGVFDDVLGQLIKRIKGQALAELSQRLGQVGNAPIEVVRRLARDDDIAVARPILTQSRRLSEGDLIEIANTKTAAHLLAIADRAQVGSNVTDALLRRGDRNVVLRLTENSGASFSENGIGALVKQSERDETLAEKIGLRLDLPLPLFCELLQRATETVRSQLVALADLESRDRIQRVLTAICEDTEHEAAFLIERDRAEAYERMLALKDRGQLNEAALFKFAKTDRYVDIVAALSLLCGVPMQLVENLLQSEHREAWLIPCKAAGLAWQTASVILSCRSIKWAISDNKLDAARAEYFKLSQENAGKVLRFWQIRRSAAIDTTR